MPAIVAIPQDITEAGKEFLREKGYELIVGSGATDAAAIAKIIAPADAILARTAPYSAEILAQAPKLKVIGRFGVGFDNIDVRHCTGRGIWVTIAANSNAISVAEHTLGFLVAASRHFAFMDSQARKGEWEARNRRKGADLHGKTLGLLGLGRIGSLVAKKAMAAFDMTVLGFDAYLPPEKYPAGVRPASADEIYAKADFLSLHLPATSETKGIINAAALAKMKRSAFLVNCARGDLIDEPALFQALSKRDIAGAALDVFAVEPVAAGNPLFRLDNIIVTPHSAGLTAEAMDRMGLEAAAGIHAVLSGGKPQSPVNQPAGA